MPKARPYAPARVLKASRRLPWGYKAVWLEDYRFDKGAGSWVSPAAMAELTGMSPETVMSYRERMLRWGLYTRVPRGRGLPDAWRPTLPAGLRPTTERVGREDLVTLARALDDKLPRRAPSKGKADHRPPPEPDHRPGVGADHRPVATADGGPGTGGVGGAASAFDSVCETQLQPAVTVPERQAGVGASAPELQAGDSRESEQVEERDPDEVRAENWALIRLQQGMVLNATDRAHVRRWLARQPELRRAEYVARYAAVVESVA